MSIEAYKVAVKISLVENVTRGLMMMARHFKTTDAEAKALQARLQSIGKMTLVGGGLLAVSAGGLKMLEGPLKEAAKYQTEMARIASLGLGNGVVAHADKFAMAANIIGNSATDMARSYGDALAVFKRADEADFVAPIMARLKFANQALYGDEGGGRDAAMMGLLKTIEYRGGTTSAGAFRSQAEMSQKIVNASRGRVNGAAMLQAMKSGGILAKLLSNHAFYLDSEPLIQEMGGFRFGTGLNAVYSNIFQGRGSITAQQELYRLGLLDRSKVQFNKLGMLKKALPGAFVGEDAMIQGGPLGLLNNVLLPAFARAGITNPTAIQNELGMIFSNSRAAALMGATFQQRSKIGMQAAANARAMGIDQTVGVAKGTLGGREADFTAKWHTLLLVLARNGGLLDLATKGLIRLTDVLQRITTWAQQNPALTKFLVQGFAVVTILAGVAGALLLLTAAGRLLMLPMLLGRLGIAFRILAAAVTYLPAVLRIAGTLIGSTFGLIALGAFLIWNNWKEISASLKIIFADVKNAFNLLFNGDILGALKVWGHAIVLGFQVIFNTLIAGLNLILPRFAQISKFNFADGWGGSAVPGGPVRTGKGGHTVLHSTINLNGKKVGQQVATIMGSMGAQPNRGGSGFDSSRHPLRSATPAP